MWPTVPDVLWSVCVCVRVLHKKVSPTNTAELTEIPLGVWTRVGPRNHVLHGGLDSHKRGNFQAHLPAHCKQDSFKNSWTNQDALWDVDSDGPKNHLLDKGPDHVGSKEPCIKWGSRSWQRLCVQRWVCSGDVDLCQITLDICYFNQCKTTFTGFVKVTSSAESALLKKTSAMLSIDWPQKTQACITLPTAANHKAKFTHIQWQQTGHCYFQYTAKKITYK